jgi:hypothetical protein
MVDLVAQEAGGALAMGVQLPDPARWAPDDVDGEAARAVEAWHRSWDLPLAEARALRDRARPGLVQGLTDHVSPETLAAELATLGEGVRRALALDAGALPAHVAVGIAEASAQLTAATRAVGRDDRAAGLEALIRGGDALREVGPEAVARDLVAQAEASLGRVSRSDPYSEQDLERLQRLVRGGRQAVDDGDWVLAIRRAYYAKGLLTGDGRDPS